MRNLIIYRKKSWIRWLSPYYCMLNVNIDTYKSYWGFILEHGDDDDFVDSKLFRGKYPVSVMGRK